MAGFTGIIISVQLLALILGEAHSETTTRLYNQSSNRFGGKEGFIQIYDQGNNTWSFVNTSDWNYSDAVVACRELGYQGVAEVTSGTAVVNYNFTQSHKGVRSIVASILPTIILTGVKCIGSEKKLLDCLKDEAITTITNALPNIFNSAKKTKKVSYKDMGKVSCTSQEMSFRYSIYGWSKQCHGDFETTTLKDGSGRHEGRVEVFYNNTWGTVCDDMWDLEDANVVCKNMGYPGALSITNSEVFGSGSTNKIIWIDDVNCKGNETTLLLCEKVAWGKSNCRHFEDAGIICKDHPSVGKYCPEVSMIENGHALDNSTEIGRKVMFACNTGFVLLGPDHITCTTRGKWDIQPPSCVKNSTKPAAISVLNRNKVTLGRHKSTSRRLSTGGTIVLCVLAALLVLVMLAIFISAIYRFYSHRKKTPRAQDFATFTEISVPLVDKANSEADCDQ